MRGERTPAEVGWLRVVRASVSRRNVWVISVVLIAAALGALLILVLTARSEREGWVFDALYDYLRTSPITDQIIAQLPQERLISVQVRGRALVARMLDPGLIALATGLLLVALFYALLARYVRAKITTLHIERVDSLALVPRGCGLFFCVTTTLAVLAHLPYAMQSVRFDEESASIYASSSWIAWANNIAGWQNHVAALLTIRLSTALFGLNEFAVRLPAVLSSSIGLALLCTYLWNRLSRWAACIAAALTMALPVWAEQTSLARGYGLVFMSAALLALGMLRIRDEQMKPSQTTMLCIFVGVCVGILAHFFFVFLVLGLFLMLCLAEQFTGPLRIAMLCWITLACIVPTLSFMLGVPATVAMLRGTAHPGFAVIAPRFTIEFAFRHRGSIGAILAVLSCGLILVAPIALPRRARKVFFVIVGVTVAGPMLANPVYVYPRYFLHALAFTIPCVAWFVSVRLFKDRPLPNVISIVAIVALWVSTHPWSVEPLVDLRAAAQIARTQRQKYGQRFAVDTFISLGVRFYNGTSGRIVNMTHPLPDDVDLLLQARANADTETPLPAQFSVAQRIVGDEYDVVLLKRDRSSL
jgi:hypothetical protein